MANIDLSSITSGIGGFVVNGEAANDQSGTSVFAAGDVNGDGLDDLIIGAPYSNSNGGKSGRSYVVFGKSDGSAIDLADVINGIGGFTINAEAAYDHSGRSVSAAGDVNGDGLADLIVGAWSSYANGSSYAAGRSYVVFGKCDASAVNLATVTTGNGGFAINGELHDDHSGRSVSAAGDVNGDGLADLIVGAYRCDANGIDSGRCYVVFGKSDGTAIDLSTVTTGSGGFVINGESTMDNSGRSVSSAGDVNGDGLADLIVGAKGSGSNGSFSGRSYVVFGKSDGGAINLTDVTAGTGGFVINGEGIYDQSGCSVSVAGDVNGDGLADLIVGAYLSSRNGIESGRSYVVFGKSDGNAINLTGVTVGTGGFVINAEAADDWSGYSVSAAGDVNGDGLSDLIVGAIRSHANGSDSGRSYVVFGKSDGSAINLADVSNSIGGFAINGEATGNWSGIASAAGDVNGDGLADLIIGALGSATNGSKSGRSYVIFGSSTGAFANTAVDQLGMADNDNLVGSNVAETIVAGTGNDTIAGNGGADVIYAGAGDDSIITNADNIAQLSSGISNGNYARVDGGSGIDTLTLDGSDINLDLTAIANQGGGAPSSSSRIESIEKIDLSGSGNNSLILTVRDVIDMAGFNLFNDGNGWNGLSASINKHQLVIEGNRGDSLNLVNMADWSFTGTASNGANSYNVFNNINAAQVLVNNRVDSLNFNDTPTVVTANTPADQSALVGTAYNLTIASNAFNDADIDDSLSYSAKQANGSALPAWLSFDANSLSFSGTPTIDDASTLNIRVTATDGSNASAHDDFMLISRNPVYAADLLANSKDQLTGMAGNDLINGGAGADGLKGGAGDDLYIVDNKGDKVSEAANQGTDDIQASISYKLGKNLENLTLTLSGDLTGTGNELANQLTGNSGNNMLDGGKGVDRYSGGAGNDTFLLDSLLETDIIESPDDGNDTIQLKVDKLGAGQTSADYSLADNVENLILTGQAQLNLIGNAGDNSLTGNAKANQLSGGDGADMLDGGTSIDIMKGGSGNDTYLVDNKLDAVDEENNSDNADWIRASIGIDLKSVDINNIPLYTGIENAALTGNAALKAYGNNGDNILLGNNGNNWLDGRSGLDSFAGGKGNDTYVVDSADDIITESANGGTDSVQSSVTYTLSDNIENLTLTGTAPGIHNINATGNILKNTLIGNDGNNALDGGDNVDVLKGGFGDDSYYVDLIKIGSGVKLEDTVIETAAHGTDSLILRAGNLGLTSAATIGLAANLEHIDIHLTNNNLLNITGNSAANEIIGNSNANILDGGLGNDILTGGDGNDIFVFSKPLNASPNIDTITDFTTGDLIQLNKAIFATLGQTGTLNVDYFHIGNSASDGNDQIIFNYDAGIGHLYYDKDGTGNAVQQVEFAHLTGVSALSNTDFWVP